MMKSLTKRQNLLKGLPVLICFVVLFLSSCDENSLTKLGNVPSLQSSNSTTFRAKAFDELADYNPILYSAHLKHPKMSLRAIYRKFSPSQKYTVWENHFHDVLVNIKLTKKQRKLLKKIKKKLSPALFTKNADRSDFMGDKKIKTITNVFGRCLAGSVFTSFSPAIAIKRYCKKLS